MLRIIAFYSTIIVACHAEPAFAAPLFVGSAEIDTEDLVAIERLVEHCTGLAFGAETEGSDPAVLSGDMRDSPRPTAPTQANRLFKAISSEVVMSPGAADGSADQTAADAAERADIDSVGFEDCQGAGLLP